MNDNIKVGLIESGILSAPENEIEISESFSRDVDEMQEFVNGADPDEVYNRLSEALRKHLDPEFVQILMTKDDRLLSYLLVIDNREVNIPLEYLRPLLLIIDHLEKGMPKDSDSPESFLPIRPDQLDIIKSLYEKFVLYIWREECDPCDLMKTEFDDILQDEELDLGLFALYGPSCAQKLQKEYDVHAGPTTLFFLREQIDTRLVGAQYRSPIKNELETLDTL